jgi:uncharacterized protein (DUF2252 family)
LTLKLALLRKDPFAFFRGTNPLFLQFLPRQHSLLRAPCVLICGDLHLENFGAFKGDNRLCYFDVNDFDEACLAPFTIDIVRFIASIKVASPGLGLSTARTNMLVRETTAHSPGGGGHGACGRMGAFARLRSPWRRIIFTARITIPAPSPRP